MSALEASSNGLDLNGLRSSASDKQSMFASLFSGVRALPASRGRTVLMPSTRAGEDKYGPQMERRRDRDLPQAYAPVTETIEQTTCATSKTSASSCGAKGSTGAPRTCTASSSRLARLTENKNYLNLKSDCSASDLNAIMADYYASENYEREKLTGNANLGKRDPPNVVTNLKPEFDRSTRIFSLRPTERSFTRLASGDETVELRDHKRMKL